MVQVVEIILQRQGPVYPTASTMVADDMFMLSWISLKFVPKIPINNK